MKRISLSLMFFASVALIGCKDENKEKDDQNTSADTEMNSDMDENGEDEVKKVTVTLEPKSDSDLEGEVVFTEEDGEVSMTAIISGLTEGQHAIHIHETADCSADDGSSAGGHWNPTFEQHGKWGDAEGYHKGDIGNFDVDENGNGTISMTTDEWCIDCGDEEKDIIGKSIIVHDGVDDYVSQPAGDAGNRIGCGIIEM